MLQNTDLPEGADGFLDLLKDIEAEVQSCLYGEDEEEDED
jgi:hypothetical protein